MCIHAAIYKIYILRLDTVEVARTTNGIGQGRKLRGSICRLRTLQISQQVLTSKSAGRIGRYSDNIFNNKSYKYQTMILIVSAILIHTGILNKGLVHRVKILITSPTSAGTQTSTCNKSYPEIQPQKSANVWYFSSRSLDVQTRTTS